MHKCTDAHAQMCKCQMRKCANAQMHRCICTIGHARLGKVVHKCTTKTFCTNAKYTNARCTNAKCTNTMPGTKYRIHTHDQVPSKFTNTGAFICAAGNVLRVILERQLCSSCSMHYLDHETVGQVGCGWVGVSQDDGVLSIIDVHGVAGIQTNVIGDYHSPRVRSVRRSGSGGSG